MMQPLCLSSAHGLADVSALACWPHACCDLVLDPELQAASMQETVDNLGDDDQWECPECEDSRCPCTPLTCTATPCLAFRVQWLLAWQKVCKASKHCMYYVWAGHAAQDPLHAQRRLCQKLVHG